MVAAVAVASLAESDTKAAVKPITTAARRTKMLVAAASDAAPSTSATAHMNGSRRGKNVTASGTVLQSVAFWQFVVRYFSYHCSPLSSGGLIFHDV
jgi:hypothetical protein